MRIVFMGTPEFAVPALKELACTGHDIVAVYTKPDKPEGRGRVMTQSPVKLAALECGLSVMQPASLRDAAEVKRMSALKPDLIVVAAYGLILPQSVLDIPEYHCLNIHPSLLPLYRGATPIPAAILAGDEKAGITIMQLDAGMDTGPILAQFLVDIEPVDTTGTLTEKLARAGARLIVETLQPWFDGVLTPRPQDESRATCTSPISKEDGQINWNLSAVEIWRRVRAFQPWPGAYTRWRGRLLKIIEAVPLENQVDAEPGSVIAPVSNPLAAAGVQTGKGVLGLISVQLEGKRVMSSVEFLRGQSKFAGDILGA